MRFEAPASARPCGAAGSGGLVLQGVSGGNGIIVWLRYRDSLASGAWPVLQRSDTATAVGAVVAARFVAGEVARGVSLDSGAVSVQRVGSLISVRARGSGLEVVGAGRVAVDASFEAVPVGSDTVPCLKRP